MMTMITGINGEIDMGTIDKKTVTFEAGMYYLINKGMLLKKTSSAKDMRNTRAIQDDDIILVAVKATDFIGEKDKPKPVTKALIIDFTKKELTIDGAKCVLNKVEYEGDSVYELDKDELADWEDLLDAAYRLCPTTTTVIGTPPIEGLIQ